MTIDLLLRGLILLGVCRSEIAKVLVFEEPKSLLLGDVTVTSTAESKKAVFWSTYKFFPGKSFPEKPQQAYSSNRKFDVNELIYEDEVAYG